MMTNTDSQFDLFQLCFIFGAIFVCSAGVMSYFMEPEFSKVMVYPTVILLGCGFSAMLVNSLSFATELIGENKVSQLCIEHRVHISSQGNQVAFVEVLQDVAQMHANKLRCTR